MRRAVRAIIIHDNKLLVLHRNKFGKEYDTLPGGNIELHETAEDALVREVFEETSVRFTDPKLTFVEEAGDPYGTQFVYVCSYTTGTPALQEGSEEHLVHSLGKNLYEPRWLPLSKLQTTEFLSEKLKHAILLGVSRGFPEQPTQIR